MTRSQEVHQPTVLIIGLDGATFNLTSNLGRRRAAVPGASCKRGDGDLTSTIPPVSRSSMDVLRTGKTPANRVAIFVEPQPGGYQIRYTNALALARTIWEILD
jgi:predicted AlkP superfamily phosphohydrolase/phosphomutase